MPPNPQGKTKYKKQIVTLFESLERTARPEFRPKIRKLTDYTKSVEFPITRLPIMLS